MPFNAVAEDARFKFELYDEHAVVVKGNIRGVPVSMLIDTGSIDTILDASTSKRLGVETYDNVTIALLNGTRTGRKALLDYELGSLSFTQAVVVTDLSEISSVLGITINLILGYNSLCRHQSLHVDYDIQQLTFGEGPGDCGSALPIVPAKVPGRSAPIHLLVDTGNKGLLLFGVPGDYGFVASAKRTSRDPGKIASVFGTIRAISLQDTVLANQEAYLIQRPRSVPALIDGFLGGGALGLRSLRINFRTQTVDLTFR